jgi:hypothetical protein
MFTSLINEVSVTAPTHCITKRFTFQINGDVDHATKDVLKGTDGETRTYLCVDFTDLRKWKTQTKFLSCNMYIYRGEQNNGSTKKLRNRIWLCWLSPAWEAASCAVTQEFSNILWNPKVHYRVCKSPSTVHILSQINAVRTTPSYLSRINCNPPTCV